MKVTVITPVLNGASTISRCINSVKAQDYKDIEYIIIDGGSTDDTVEIIQSCGIQYISEPDAGIYDAFNKGIRAATGEIIHILNADDMYAATDVITRMVNHMISLQLSVGHGYVEQINQAGQVIKRIGKDVSKQELLSKMRVAHPSAFIRKHVYLKYGGYSVGFKIAADHEFFLRIWDACHVGFLPIVTTKMRLGGASNSQVELSYRESLSASILHDANPIKAIVRYYYERLKSILPGVQPKP
ncbi:MAG: glycosyltransferase [Candidatus Polarisedimenticolaceae bacterium]|nr:glycosyltransferase [Candidatus Polarisedimenticolaceae bacterium]